MYTDIETAMVVTSQEDAYPYLEWLEGEVRPTVCRPETADIDELPSDRAVVIVDQPPIDEVGPHILDRIRRDCRASRVISFTRSQTRAPIAIETKSDAWIRRPIHQEQFTTFVDQYRRIVRYEQLLEEHFELLQSNPYAMDSNGEVSADSERLHRDIRSIESTFGRADYVAAFRAITKSVAPDHEVATDLMPTNHDPNNKSQTR